MTMGLGMAAGAIGLAAFQAGFLKAASIPCCRPTQKSLKNSPLD
jgi:hypothetical protein